MPRKPGAKAKIKVFLLDRIGEMVTAKQLQQVSGVFQFARRVRELRDIEGWTIHTHNDDSTLKPGEYRLVKSPPENYQFVKHISASTRAQVLERNGYTCQMCGAGAGDPDEHNPARKVRLHIGHIVDKSHGGADTLSNLRALCSTCNQGAKNVVPEPPSWAYLLGQIRRASNDDQRKVKEWLDNKFRSEE